MSCALCANVLHDVCNILTIHSRIHFETQALALLNDPRPYHGPILSDPTREYQCVYFTFQLDVIAANEADYAVNEDIDGELAFRIRRGGYFAKIGGSSQSFPARLVVENVFGLSLVSGILWTV